MARKTQHAIAGRPPKDPSKKVGWPERFLVTPQVQDSIDQLQERLGLEVRADVHRLALYMLLAKQGMMTADIAVDPTFDALRNIGLV